MSEIDIGYCNCGQQTNHAENCVFQIILTLYKQLEDANRKIEWLVDNAGNTEAVGKFREGGYVIPSIQGSSKQLLPNWNAKPQKLISGFKDSKLPSPRGRDTQYEAMPPSSFNKPQVNFLASNSFSKGSNGNAPNSPVMSSSPGSAPGPMIESQFQALLQKIAGAPSNVRERLIREASERHLFTCFQLEQVVEKLTFADERLMCTEILGPKILDPESYTALLSKDLRRIMERIHKRNTVMLENKTNEDVKKLKARQLVVEEIIQTERDYVKDLETTVKIFLQPLEERNLLNKQDIANIFSNIMVLVPLSKQILSDFEMKQGLDIVGDVFLRMAEFLKIFSDYCANQPVALDTLEKCKKKYPKFAQFLEECMANPESRGLNLFAFLIKPVQRLCKYPLLLRELLNNTPSSHNDYEYLTKAYGKINEVVEYVNERKRLAENLQRILDIQNTLEDCQMDLVDPARRFINEGTIKILGKNQPKQGKIFLFNDLVLWAKNKEGILGRPDFLKYVAHIHLSNLRMVDIADSIEHNAWELEDKVKLLKVTMATATPEEKKNWLADLRAILKEFQKRAAQEQKTPENLTKSKSGNFLSYNRGFEESTADYPADVACDRCRDQRASVHCTECDLPFCETCFQDVHSKGKYKLHNFQSYNQTAAIPNNYGSNINGGNAYGNNNNYGGGYYQESQEPVPTPFSYSNYNQQQQRAERGQSSLGLSNARPAPIPKGAGQRPPPPRAFQPSAYPPNRKPNPPQNPKGFTYY